MSTLMGPNMQAVLEALERKPGLTFRDIARENRIRHKSASSRTLTLRSRGLVEAQDDDLPWHKRRWHLTDEGQRRLDVVRLKNGNVHSTDPASESKVSQSSS